MDRLRNFGFLLTVVSRKYLLRFEQRAKQISLSLPTCKVLANIQRNEGINQTKLTELTSLDQMAVVRILDRLEADGLVERRPDPADRRARCLYLTAKAAPTLNEIWRLAAQTRAEVFAGIAQNERDVFLDVLTRLAHNLDQLDDLTNNTVNSDANQNKPIRAQTKQRSR
jgi:MarR family transcriptional regulator for hemolysin